MHQRFAAADRDDRGPMSARISSRFFISSSGTGFEKSSKFIAVRTGQVALPHRDDVQPGWGCFVETSAFPDHLQFARAFRRKRSRLRSRVFVLARTTFVSSAMKEADSPTKNYT